MLPLIILIFYVGGVFASVIDFIDNLRITNFFEKSGFNNEALNGKIFFMLLVIKHGMSWPSRLF